MSQTLHTPAGTALDRILAHNRAFTASREARALPPADPRRLAVVACYDPRLDTLLLQALGLQPSEAFMLRTAGALIQPKGGVMRSLGLAVFMFGVTDIVIVGHTSCRMATFQNAEFVDMFRRRGVPREAFGTEDLREWAGAISDPARGVQASMRNVADAAFLPRDVRISGLVLDDTTGTLAVVGRSEAKEEAKEDGAEPEQAATPAEAAQAASQAGTVPASPELDSLMAGVGSWLVALEKKAAWKGEVGKLRRDLATHHNPIQRVKLLEAFARKASGESKDVVRAFEQIKKEVQAAPAGKIPETLHRFFGRWAGGSTGGAS
jgi:carbonic anhydrase